MDKYTTIQGDTWDGICYKLFRSIAPMPNLMALNPEHMRTAIFGAGIVLTLPVVEPAPAAGLPPWKRGEAG